MGRFGVHISDNLLEKSLIGDGYTKKKIFLFRLFCNHEFIFVSNIHGDMINYTSSRSIWNCSKCGKVKFSPKYVHEKDYNRLKKMENITKNIDK